MDILIISGAAIGLFLLSFVLSKQPKLQADKYLIIYLSFFVVSQTHLFLEQSARLDGNLTVLLGKGYYLLGAPLFFFYVYALSGKHVSWRLVFSTISPFLIYTAVTVYYQFWVFDQNQVVIVDGLLYINGTISIVWAGFVVLFMLTDPFYLVWFYLLLKDYKKTARDSQSNYERVNTYWLNLLFYIWVVSACVLFPITVLSVGQSVIPPQLPVILLQLANVIFIFVLGYYGFRETSTFGGGALVVNSGSRRKYSRSGLSVAEASQIHTKLISHMEKEKPYLDGDLNANDLAGQLGISVSHLSQVLNQVQHQNFFDFVNTHRVEEVKRKMSNPEFDRYTLLAIALDSGFSAKTSFNSVFKKLAGITPSEFQQQSKDNSPFRK
ncbi:MAG: helix-turn-helix domain-containing protein [Cyclobacteriaceae bacterium]